MRALCRARGISAAGLYTLRRIAGENDTVLACPAAVVLLHQFPDNRSAQQRVRNLLRAEQVQVGFRTCDALSLLPAEEIAVFAEPLRSLLEVEDVRVTTAAARAYLKYNQTSPDALVALAAALGETTTVISTGYYYPSNLGVTLDVYAASVFTRVGTAAQMKHWKNFGPQAK